MRYLVGLYGVTVLLAVTYFEIWGQTAHRSFFANLGRAVVWPAIMFPSFGKLLSGLIWLAVIIALLLLVRRQ